VAADDDDPESSLWAPRMALLVTLSVLVGYTLTTLMNVLGQSPGPLMLVAVSACLALTLALQLLHSTRSPRSWPARTRALTLSAQAVATYAPLAWFGLPWGAMAGFLAGSLLLAVPGRVRWLLYLLSAVAIVPVVLALYGPEAGAAIYGAGVTLLTGFIVYGVSSLTELVEETRETRSALARMAVVAERLRVARDLHDLLGYRLSAITLKNELAYRLLPAAPERAGAEIAETLVIVREALADVRLVATGYRDMSVRAEADSAVSVLSSARIRVRAEVASGPLSREVDTALSIVLREAVTNVLRHSKAQHCEISAVRDGGRVRLAVSNDGVEAEPPGRRGVGLDNLRIRMEAVGGTLESGRLGEDRFRVTATAPAPDAEEPSAPEPEERRGRSWAPNHTLVITVMVLAGYLLIMLINAGTVSAASAVSAAGVLATLGCLAAVFGLQLLHSLRRPRTWPLRLRVMTLAVQGAATYAPLLWTGRPWGAMAGFFAGSLLLSGAAPARWALFAGSVAVLAPIAAAEGEPASYDAYLVVSSLVAGLVVYGVTTMYALVVEIREARDALARLAVTRERLAVAHELNEGLGAGLSEIALKGELIHRLLPGTPDAAQAEIIEVLDVSRRTLADVRLVASGYRGRAPQRNPPSARQKEAGK